MAQSDKQPSTQIGNELITVLKRALDEIQRVINDKYATLRSLGTCSHEFVEWLEDLEKKADSELVYRGFEKLPELTPSRKETKDLSIAYYRVNSIIVEIGLLGLNKCGILERLTEGKPPRVYARVYVGGTVALLLESSLEPRETREAHYII
jgi:hypothetical protein